MQLFKDFKILFEQPNWKNDLELGLIDSILERHPHIIATLGTGISDSKSKKNIWKERHPQYWNSCFVY